MERLTTSSLPRASLPALSQEPTRVRLWLVRSQRSAQAPRLHSCSTKTPLASNLLDARSEIAVSIGSSLVVLEVSQRTSISFCISSLLSSEKTLHKFPLFCFQDAVWRGKCIHHGWFLPYEPESSEYGAWKRHYVSCTFNVDTDVPSKYIVSLRLLLNCLSTYRELSLVYWAFLLVVFVWNSRGWN